MKAKRRGASNLIQAGGSMWPDRWTSCELDPRQWAFYNSRAMINVVPAGRRSWKTEGAKRRLVLRAIAFARYSDGRFFACAPTHQQAADIYWDDLKALTPVWALRSRSYDRDISESTRTIYLRNGAIIRVAGLDKPARIEGKDWDGGVVDEYADCKGNVLDEHIMPMMVRGGYVDVIGVPGGRNHYYELAEKVKHGQLENARYFHWTAEEVLHLYLGAERTQTFLRQMRAQMDPLTYDQEFNASFVTFEGRVYYTFDRNVHAVERISYDPGLPLIFCFDFNVAPGVAIVCQEQQYKGPRQAVKSPFTAVVDEVYIPRNSNTPKVCEQLIQRYGAHSNLVYAYGDATGGASGTAKIRGSDWAIIDEMMNKAFGNRYFRTIPTHNPPERVRVNSVNAHFKSIDGSVRTLIDPTNCPMTLRDFEGVVFAKGGSTLIEKDKDSNLTHLSDAFGYYVHYEWPMEAAASSLAAG